MLSLHNTLSRKKEVFQPTKRTAVSFYACGPTVYDAQHIGNFRTYIFNDILRRTLEYNGYRVKQVINITDVGHLTSDADTGEDKIQAAARRKRKTAWQIARLFENQFKEDLKRLNIKPPYRFARATDHVKEQIALIKKLERKGYTYLIPDEGVYFDTSKLSDYGKLMPSRLKGLKAGARVKLVKGKHSLTDFALWKFSSKNEKRDMEWNSPWGKGFPGWHVECSAMALKYLGQPTGGERSRTTSGERSRTTSGERSRTTSGERSRTIDIHTGGIEHIPIHHTNEIAQSEAATGKKFVNYWLHGEHLLVNSKKMSKSLKNFYILRDLEKKGINPLSFRYFVLNAHYRSKLNFTWKGITAAEQGLYNLYRETARLSLQVKSVVPSITPQDLQILAYKSSFYDAINDNLNTPKALAVAWDVVANKTIWPKNKLALLLDFDQVLGLKLKEATLLAQPPTKVKNLIKRREELRVNKQFVQADQLRKKIEVLGYTIEDTPQGPFVWLRKN